MKRRVLSLLLILSLLCALAAPAAAAGTGFSDVPQGDWAEEPIRKAVQYGLIQGVGGGRFGYGAYMTRASFVTVLARMFRWEDDPPATPSYSDVPAGTWYFSAVESARKRGVADGGGHFFPEDDVTREDMAVMLIRALGYEALAQGYSGPPPFSDVTAHSGHIALANRFGIVNGAPQGAGGEDTLLFLPTHSSTRQECAAMLVRAYERFYAELPWVHGFYAIRSYHQLDACSNLDALSLGWSRLSLDEAGAPVLNTSAAGGNEWSVPQGSDLALERFQADGVPYSLCIHAALSDRVMVNGEAASPLAVLFSQKEHGPLLDAIVAASEGYAGVTVDFEGLREAQREAFTAFVSALRQALPPERALLVCVQPPDWYGGYDYRALGELCDKMLLMAHNYQDAHLPEAWVGGGHTAEPSAPLDKVCATLMAVTHPETGIRDKSKLILAISFESIALQVDEHDRLAATTLYSLAPDLLAARLTQADTRRGWEEKLAVPYAYYTAEDGLRYRVWYEDARSVKAKATLANMFGLGGVSLWRVGILPESADPALQFDIWSSLI